MSADPPGAALRPAASRWRQPVLLVAAALVLAAAIVGRALVDPDTVFFGVDTATTQLPWAAVGESGRSPRNPDLADQGTQFYPFYRWVARSWLAGDPPAWCPLIYAGAPGFGNAQSGALDPQVGALVLLEALGGQRAFDWGLGALAGLRIVAALAGAFLLARRLGLDRAPAALAGVTFGLSGYLILWLNHSLGHVPPFLPWVLYFLEGIRRPGASGRASGLSAAGAGLALALAILGGHVETAFYVGLAAGLWCLALFREDRRAGSTGLLALGLGTALAAVSLLPAYEYVDHSAAKFVRELAAEESRGSVDLVPLGLLAVLGGLVAAFSRVLRAAGTTPRSAWLPGALGLGLAFSGVAAVLAARGLDVHARLALVPDLHGRPGVPGGYLGPGYFLEVASAWVAFPALAFAVASIVSGGGPLARRGLPVGLGALAFLLCIETPGLTDLYRYLPVVGLGATVRFGPVAALFLGLLAGDGLQGASRAARAAAACVLVPLVLLVLWPRGSEPLAPEIPLGPEGDELVGFVLAPTGELTRRTVELEGWLAPEAPAESVRLGVLAVDATGTPVSGPRMTLLCELHDEPSPSARARAAPAVAAAPEGARWFRAPPLPLGQLPAGHHRFEVELYLGGEVIHTRRAGVATIARSLTHSPATLAFLGLGILGLFFGRRRGWLVVLVAAGHALAFSRGIQVSVPRAEVFPETRTEAILARELGVHRFLTDTGVLPANTGLVRDLRAIEGYDAVDVADFNFYRDRVVPPGVNALLAWNARGVNLANPAFRLFGVSMLALRAPLSDPGDLAEWERIAAPESRSSTEGDVESAETWLYRSRDPLPRAFCVSRVGTVGELGELYARDPLAWNPLEFAALDEDWRPERPFTRATVGTPDLTNNEVRVTAELDGDGLLVVTEQAFPGWTVTVDGEERPVLRANTLFRAVALEAGEHRVVFRYAPASIRVGLGLSAAGALGLVLLAVGVGRRPGR